MDWQAAIWGSQQALLSTLTMALSLAALVVFAIHWRKLLRRFWFFGVLLTSTSTYWCFAFYLRGQGVTVSSIEWRPALTLWSTYHWMVVFGMISTMFITIARRPSVMEEARNGFYKSLDSGGGLNGDGVKRLRDMAVEQGKLSQGFGGGNGHPGPDSPVAGGTPDQRA